MADTNERSALLAHHYTNLKPQEDRIVFERSDEIRLFGSGWVFGAVGQFEPLAIPDQRSFHATHLYATVPPKLELKEPREVSHFLRQNVFAIDIYRGTHDYVRYPVKQGRQPLADSSRLILQKIKPPAGTPPVLRDRLHQLLHGRIEVPAAHQGKGRVELLDDIRRQLGLAAPAAGGHQSIFLYPDGFCVHAEVTLPWAKDRVPGWFKLTTRGAAVAGAEPADAEGGLVLCLDPALPDNDARLIATWRGVAADLRARCRSAETSAQWLSLVPRVEIGPEHFFWPAKYDANKHFFGRSNDGRLRVEAPFLAMRVRPGRTADQNIGGMEIAGQSVEIGQGGDGRLRMTSGHQPAAHDLLYSFAAGAERLEFGSGSKRELRLAIPLIDTARTIRAESGMPERGAVDEADPVGPVWTFTPLENGLLHWPFPDATLEGLQTLVEAHQASSKGKAAQTEPAPVVAEPTAEGLVNGAMLLGNGPALPEFDPSHRNWQLAVTDGSGGAFELEFEMAGAGSAAAWQLRSAQASIVAGTFAFEGVLPIVPFRQSRERLLPEHDERALRTRGLRAVSPGLLRGIEEEMWGAAANAAVRRVQATLSIRDFAITAPAEGQPAQLDGRVALHCTIASRDGGVPDPALRPWLWTRFAGLPSVQTMPLAVSGSAAARPSGTREWQPLRRSRAAATIVYSFDNALDMSRPAPRLVTDSERDGEWSYRSPAGARWTSEIGMAMLTLPSVTVFAQDEDQSPSGAIGSDRLPAPGGADWRWPLGNGLSADGKRGAVPFRIELRHDLAWRDEYYGGASLGTPAAAADDASGAFEPLAGNGPQDGAGQTSWHRAWEDADRRAALAATDGRAMVVIGPGGGTGPTGGPVYSLANFHGEAVRPIETFAAEWRPLLNGSGATLALIAAGQVTIKPAGDAAILLGGLPDDGDLSGFSGALAGVRYRFGTAAAARAAPGGNFTDQRDLQSGQFTEDGPFVRRSVGEVDLYTLPAPVDIGGKLLLWLVDVPVGPMPGEASPQTWLDRDRNHVVGYRWALTGTEKDSRGLIHWRHGIHFEPLCLTEFTPTRITITGQLGLLIGGAARPTGAPEAEPRFTPQIFKGKTERLPQLTISRTGASGWSWQIAVTEPAFLPLEAAGTGGEPPAILEVIDAATARLHFDLFGAAAEVDLTGRDNQDGSITYQNKPPKSISRAVELTHAQVVLGPGGCRISLSWTFEVGVPLANNLRLSIAGQVSHPRYNQSATPLAATTTLSDAAGTVRWTLGAGAIDHVFGNGLLAFTWSSGTLFPAGGERRSWLHLFATQGVRGGCLALLARDANTPHFRCSAARIDFETDLAGVGQPLSDKPPMLRLGIGSDQSPAPLILDGGLLLSGDAGGVMRRAEIRLDGAQVRALGRQVRLAAQVRQVLEKPSGQQAGRLDVSAVQWVTLDLGAKHKGEVGFNVAFVAQRDGQSRAVLATIPGHYDLGTNTFGPVLEVTCHLLPPLSPAVRENGQVRLRSALQAVSGSTAGWVDRLLTAVGETEREQDQVEPRPEQDVLAGGLDLLFALASEARTLLVHSLGTPEPWSFPKNGLKYHHYLQGLATQLSRLVTAVPASFVARPARRGYELHTPDMHDEHVIRVARDTSVPIPGDATRESIETWQGRLLAASAPWAGAGLLATFTGVDGLMQVRLIEPASAAPQQFRPLAPAWRTNGIAPADPHRIALPDKPDEIALVYGPVAIGALDLSYHRPGWEEEADAAILAAHALQRAWQLERFPRRTQSHYRDVGDFWLAHRETVAFRPSRAWVHGERLTARLWEPAAQAMAAALLPATAPPTSERAGADELTQFLAPAQIVLRDISSRPGVWQARRLGLAGRKSDGMALPGPELPVHARTPRPPITGRHDRLRASEFETASFALSADPECVIYGPRAAPPHQPGPTPALTRTPLAERAWRATIRHLIGSVITPDWDGKLDLSLARLSSFAGETRWELRAARAVLDGRVFPLTVATSDVQTSAEAKNASFSIDARQRPKIAGEDSPSFADHVSGLRLSTRVLIECELLLLGETQIPRLVAFELLVAGADAPRLELPFYLRFEDPAYNDRLTLSVKFASGLKQSLFCADRDNVRPDDRLLIAWRGLRPDIPKPLNFVLKVFRTPAQDGQEETVIQLEPDRFSDGAEVWAIIDCGALTRKSSRPDGGSAEPFDLQVGDRLHVLVPELAGLREAAWLEFEVTLKPLFPGNPAAFALLALDTDAPAISAPLYAQSPAPASIELVDPRDLFNGVARFRAAYRWIHFAPGRNEHAPRYAMQKIAGDGGSWIPSRAAEWQAGPRRAAGAAGQDQIADKAMT